MLNHKTIKTILIITALCLVSLAQAEEPSFEFKYSEEEAKLYRMPIKQITPKDGIWTGHVIAYGHYIKPPYKIEVKDTIVLINNVQVYPALKTPGMIEKDAETKANRDSVYEEKWQQLILDSQELYRKITNENTLEVAIDTVVKIFKNSGMCDSVQIRSNRSIKIFPKSKQVGFIISYHTFQEIEEFKKCNPMTPKEAREQSIENLRKIGGPVGPSEWAIYISKKLKEDLIRGDLVVVNKSGIWPVAYGREIAQITKVLKDEHLSKQEKINHLPKFLSYETKYMIIVNYNQKEWQTLFKEEEK